jgi:PIN domain nuclease of toxin-antitoxin system
MNRLYVADTTSIISYFNEVFNVPRKLSTRGCLIIQQALSANPSNIRLSIPSVVLVEIFDKWFLEDEIASKLRYEVFEPIKGSPNVEVKPIEQEVLENMLKIGDELGNHDMHDKIILASAMMLNCPLITTDSKLISYIRNHKVVSYVS